MAVSSEWWGNLCGDDYIGTMPNPLNRIKQLHLKYGIRYIESDDRQQLPLDRGVCGVPDRGDSAEGVRDS